MTLKTLNTLIKKKRIIQYGLATVLVLIIGLGIIWVSGYIVKIPSLNKKTILICTVEETDTTYTRNCIRKELITNTGGMDMIFGL